jgi:hypothetical protein
VGTIASTLVTEGDLEALHVAVMGVVSAVYILAQAVVDAKEKAQKQLKELEE